jgi:hypothetical protein
MTKTIGSALQFILLVSLVGILGCGDSGRVPVYPIRGKVTLDGKPVGGARVTFLPIDADEEIADFHPGGKTDQSGVFQLRTYEKNDGAPEAKYAVLVQWNAPDRFTKDGDIPEDWGILGDYYGDRENPQFHATVTSEENPELLFDLLTPEDTDEEEDEDE